MRTGEVAPEFIVTIGNVVRSTPRFWTWFPTKLFVSPLCVRMGGVCGKPEGRGRGGGGSEAPTGFEGVTSSAMKGRTRGAKGASEAHGAGKMARYETLRQLGRGLHSSTSQLNMSALYGIGGARRGCVACVTGGFKGCLGVLGVCRVFSCDTHGST